MNNVVPIGAAKARSSREGADLNVRVLTCLGRFLAEKRGQDALQRVTSAAGLEPGALDGKTRWVSHELFERLLAAARAELTSDDELFEACLYKYAESYGLIRYLVMLVSPMLAYEKGAQMFDLASRMSTMEAHRVDARRVRMTYRTTRDESRLMCISRMSSLVVTPTLWGLPRAQVTERTCVARGDDCCSYEVSIYRHADWLPTLIGGLIGAGAAGVLQLGGVGSLPPWILLPLVGMLIGYLRELRSVLRHNVGMGDRSQELLREVARDDADARKELLALHRRNDEWARLMEEQFTERSTTLDEVTERIRAFRADTQTTLRGLSHDIRNPLQVLAAESTLLRMYFRQAGIDSPEVLTDHDTAVQKIERLLVELMDFLTTERGGTRVLPATIEVAGLADRLRRQMRALTHGRSIRTSVFAVREAPEHVTTDPMILDRILDNLLTNAAKYTDEGSIVVEVGGTPGMLTVKVSDTGEGIEANNLEHIFDGKGTEGSRKPGSYGIGLSVVVDLLQQIGGRIEIMSKPHVGTTVWAHVPVVPVADSSTQSKARPGDRQRVITIRRTTGDR